MAEYIDRKALLEKLCDGDASRMEDFYYNAIADFPAADVVPVVRCKDCYYFSTMNRKNNAGTFTFCHKIICGVKADDFCSYGERRTDD